MTVLETLTILLILLSLLFSAFLVSIPSVNQLGNRILAAFLIIRSIDASSIFFHKLIHPVVDQLRHDIGGFLQAPLLFLFLLTIIFSDFKLQKKHLYHLIPLALSIIVWMPNFYLPKLGINTSFSDGSNYFEGRFTYILAAFQSIIYIAATYLILLRYRKLYYQNYSSTKPFNHQWLLTMNHIALGLFIMASVKNLVKFSDLDDYLFTMRVLTTSVMVFFVSWLTFKALVAPSLFRGVQSSLDLIPQIMHSTDRQLPPEVQERLQKIEAHLEKHESYLNPDLTISGLADELKMDAKELSELINRQKGQNFYKLVSDYRIEKAKTILSDKTQNHLPILEVLYSVGFNSKSSFNQAFKRNTGLTPTEYRKSLQS